MKTFVLALATALTAVTAHATAPVQNVREQVVSYADLDLQNASDAETLLRRIKSAARNVCGLRDRGPVPLDILNRQQCARSATARAVADVSARHDIEIRVATIARQ